MFYHLLVIGYIQYSAHPRTHRTGAW